MIDSVWLEHDGTEADAFSPARHRKVVACLRDRAPQGAQARQGENQVFPVGRRCQGKFNGAALALYGFLTDRHGQGALTTDAETEFASTQVGDIDHAHEVASKHIRLPLDHSGRSNHARRRRGGRLHAINDQQGFRRGQLAEEDECCDIAACLIGNEQTAALAA